MDDRLLKRINRAEDQSKDLREAERKALGLEGNEKAMYSQLFIKADGKTVEERKANAYASEDWKNFVGGLVEAQVERNYAKRLYDLRVKAIDCEYLTMKTESPIINRQK